jgi:DNA-binding winged helix-turn-helix (wHTH) protein/TolB-like protein
MARVIYRFGVFDFDVESGQLRKNGHPLSLERQPARVLAALLARAGELVSREELRESVWDRDTHVDFDRGLAYCLSQIRAALDDRSDSPRFIQTFPKRGYKFIAPVTVESSIPPTQAAIPAERPAASRLPRLGILAAVSLSLLLLAAWFFVNNRPANATLIAVSIFDNETGIAEYDRPIAGLSDLVVANLANLAPGRLAVIGNAEVLRRPRNIRNLTAVAEGIRADYVLLGQLQQGEQGLRFVTHFIRLRDRAHLKANRLALTGNGISGLEVAVVDEFERAVREHVLTESGN